MSDVNAGAGPATIREVALPGPTVLVVPCYDEAARIRPGAFVDAIRRYPGLRLLFVDDGSRDGTLGLLQDIARRTHGLAWVKRLPVNAGKAEAVRQGMLAALDTQPAFVGYWDADLATPLDALRDFLEVFRLRPEVELVLGSRVMLLGRHVVRRAARHYVGRLFATAASLALQLPVYDTQCGAKLFRANERVGRVFAAPFSTRWIFDVEVLDRFIDAWEAEGTGRPRSSVPIYELVLRVWIDEPGSKVRLRDGIRAAIDLGRIHRMRRRRAAGRASAEVTAPGVRS